MDFKNMILEIFLIFAIFGLPLHSEVITLQECFEAAAQNHPVMKKPARHEKINQTNLKNINSTWLPQIDLEARASYQSEVTAIDLDLSQLSSNQAAAPSIDFPTPENDQYDASIKFKQKLYDFGATQAQKKLTKIEGEKSQSEVEQEFYQVKQTITQYYLQSLILKKQMAILETSLEDIQATQKVVQSGVENGVLLPSDLHELQARELENKQKLIDVRQSIAGIFQNLEELTGISNLEKTELQSPQIKLSESKQINRPENQLFQIQSRQLNQLQKVTFRNKLPKMSGYVKFGYGRPGLNMLNDQFDSYYMAGIQFSWNIWDWGQNKRERNMLRIQQKLVADQQNAFNKEIQTRLNQQKNDIEKYEKLLKTDQKIINLNKKILQENRSKLRNGTITSSDYVKKLNSLSRARLNYESHKIQLTTAKVNYQLLKGEL